MNEVVAKQNGSSVFEAKGEKNCQEEQSHHSLICEYFFLGRCQRLDFLSWRL